MPDKTRRIEFSDTPKRIEYPSKEILDRTVQAFRVHTRREEMLPEDYFYRDIAGFVDIAPLIKQDQTTRQRIRRAIETRGPTHITVTGWEQQWLRACAMDAIAAPGSRWPAEDAEVARQFFFPPDEQKEQQ